MDADLPPRANGWPPSGGPLDWRLRQMENKVADLERIVRRLGASDAAQRVKIGLWNTAFAVVAAALVSSGVAYLFRPEVDREAVTTVIKESHEVNEAVMKMVARIEEQQRREAAARGQE